MWEHYIKFINPLALQREGTKRDVFSFSNSCLLECEANLGLCACASLAGDVACLLLFVIYLFMKMRRCMNEMNGETQEPNDCK